MTCQDCAEQTGETNLVWCQQRFDDLGQSGATLDRPGMRKLRKVIDLGGIDRVYAVALDRVTRSMRDAILILDEFEKAGVELRLVHQPDLTSGPENRFLKHVLAAFAEFERDMIATRIAESRAYLKKHGRRLAGPVPFGYDADPQTKQHARILDTALYQAAQDQLAGRRTTSSTDRNRMPFALRGKVICPKRHRPLATYMNTRGGQGGKRIYRYYRCRSNAGGRPPCKEVSYSVWELEDCIVEYLKQESTWADLLADAGKPPENATVFAETWRSLNPPSQERLLSKIIERVELRRAKTELEITFDPRIVEAVSSGE